MTEKPTNSVPPESSMEEFKPMDIICLDCKARFTWTAGEQKYYKDRGLAAPRRCSKCRFERRKSVNGAVNISDGNNDLVK